ncbi:MAG TPA: hypothetical protein VN848_11550 [Gemmatimonadales bacterium]|nr:hypothetical protein [Gemmatimonadales bacterium]
MILSRLVAAWLLVTACWLVVDVATRRVTRREVSRHLAQWRCIEALLVTLFGSLWFASLGSGEWWVLFVLVGAMVAGTAAATPRDGTRASKGLSAAIDAARYVVAGGILAARLG